MNESHFDFGQPERDETPITIRPTRPMLLLRPGEQQPRHAPAGELVTVPAFILGMLAPSDWRRVESDP